MRRLALQLAPIAIGIVSGFVASTALASDQIGTLTQLEGTVKIFNHPSKVLQTSGDSPSTDGSARALFQGEYYHVRDAKIGDRVEHGNIVRTAPGSKVRVVFDNGDQYNVGPGTAYRVFWDKDETDTQTKIDLMYGKLRGVVTKGGPRSHLLIRTKSATMGVRGTDFFIASGTITENGVTKNETEVSIVRGQVEVTPIAVSKEPVKVMQVKAGYSADVSAPVIAPKTQTQQPTPAAPVKIIADLRKTTQEDLAGIQKSSEIQATIVDAPKKVQVLEEKAVQAVIHDMKASDPKLFAQVEGKIFKSTDELNHIAVEKLVPEAPKAPPKRKPYKSEIENLEDGAYEKYFKPEGSGPTSTPGSSAAE